jgi:hypothetical protein
MIHRRHLHFLLLAFVFLFPFVRPLTVQAAVRCAVIFITFDDFPCNTDCAFLICDEGSGVGACRQGLCFA